MYGPACRKKYKNGNYCNNCIFHAFDEEPNAPSSDGISETDTSESDPFFCLILSGDKYFTSSILRTERDQDKSESDSISLELIGWQILSSPILRTEIDQDTSDQLTNESDPISL